MIPNYEYLQTYKINMINYNPLSALSGLMKWPNSPIIMDPPLSSVRRGRV
jgi:hypothetical protein